MKKFLEIFGWYGTVAIVGAYALVSFSIIQSDSALYQLLNLTGAIGIVAVSLVKKAYQPATLNIIWTVIAAIALIKLFF
ncbi:hypothetical protein EPN90_01500 [Patescibacteria group bacterium]|nr:MAG: hypothetical protein EPN90_01500 [Patescibacteria group bacterium]